METQQLQTGVRVPFFGSRPSVLTIPNSVVLGGGVLLFNQRWRYHFRTGFSEAKPQGNAVLRLLNPGMGVLFLRLSSLVFHGEELVPSVDAVL